MYIDRMIKKNLADNSDVRIFPKPLQHGDHAAIIAASSPLSEQSLKTAAQSIEFLGLKPVIMPSCECVPPRPWIASDDRRRAADILSALADPQIHGIFFARGGYGSARIVPYIDFESFRHFPKFMLGSSDLTFLLNAVSARSGLVTFHGPMPSVDGGYNRLDDLSKAALCAAVFGVGGRGAEPGCESWDCGWPECVQGSGSPAEHAAKPGGGDAAGPVMRLPFKYSRIIGGNLTVLCSMLGTPYEPDFNDAAVFLEDVNEPLYKIDRMLTTLALSGRLSRCAGIVFGSFKCCCAASGAADPADTAAYGADEQSLLLELMEEAGRRTGRPVVTGQPFGHELPSVTFPIG